MYQVRFMQLLILSIFILSTTNYIILYCVYIWHFYETVLTLLEI